MHHASPHHVISLEQASDKDHISISLYIFPTTAHDTICTAPRNLDWGKFWEEKKKDRVSKEPNLIREQKYLLHYFKRQVLCFSDTSCFKNSFPQLFRDLSVLFYEIDFEDVTSFTWSKLQIISHSSSTMMLRPGILSPLGSGAGAGAGSLDLVGVGTRWELGDITP